MEPVSGDGELARHRALSDVAFDYAFELRFEDGRPVVAWLSDSWIRDFSPLPDLSDIFARVHPADQAAAVQGFEELATGRAIEGELRMLPASRGEVWVRYRSTPIHDEATGAVVGCHGVLQDIHDRKLAEELWRRAEAKYRAQYQASPIPTYTWQRVGDGFVLIDFNEAARELTNGAVARLVGKTAHELYGDEPQIPADLDEVFETGVTLRRERDYRLRSTGEQRHFLVSMTSIPPNMVLVHTIDQTDWKRAEAERRTLRAELRAAP